MAQTLTVNAAPSLGQFDKLKVCVINVANGANETSVAINFATYGLNEVLWYDFIPRDTHTANAVGWFANVSGTTVTYTWTAADIANALVVAIGY